MVRPQSARRPSSAAGRARTHTRRWLTAEVIPQRRVGRGTLRRARLRAGRRATGRRRRVGACRGWHGNGRAWRGSWVRSVAMAVVAPTPPLVGDLVRGEQGPGVVSGVSDALAQVALAGRVVVD